MSEAEMPAPRGRSKAVARLGKLALVVVTALAVVYGILWWQDRPLRDVRQKLDRGQPELALARVNFFLDAHPEDVRALALKARALADVGQTQEAIALFEKVGVVDSSEMLSLGRAYLRVAQWSRALPLFAQVTRTEPANADAWQDLIGCQFQLGSYSQGVASAERLAQLPGHQARGVAWQAFFYHSIDDRPKALEAYAKVLEISPDAKDLPVSAHEFLLRYGQTILADGRADDARKVIERSIAMEPSAEAVAALAQLQEQAGDRAGAEKSYRQALDLDPAQPDACEALAQRALDAGEYETAQRRLTPLAGLPLPSVKTARILAAVFEESGDPVEARQWRARLKQLEARQAADDAVKRLLRKAPDSLLAQAVRAHQFASQGNWTQAYEVLEPYREEGSRDPFVQDLWAAINQRGPLPSLELLPLDQF